MRADLKLTPLQFQLGEPAGILLYVRVSGTFTDPLVLDLYLVSALLFVTYVAFELPSNLLLKVSF